MGTELDVSRETKKAADPGSCLDPRPILVEKVALDALVVRISLLPRDFPARLVLLLGEDVLSRYICD